MFAQEESITPCSDSNNPSKGTHKACVLSQLLHLAAMQLQDSYFEHEESPDFFHFFLGYTDSFSSFAMLNQSMYTLLDALFDAGRTTESLAHLMEMKDILKNRECSNWRSTIDKVNHLVCATIARIHFAQCDYAQANQLMFSILEFDRQLFSTEQSYFLHLAGDIFFAAIASCCVDEHQQGVALLAQLEDLEQKVLATHPELYIDVQWDLEMDAEKRKVGTD